MRRSLDLIIPVYNSHDTLVRALASVAVNDIDFKLKVYIVNDGSSKGYSEEAGIFKDLLDITIFDLDVNRGVGYARKYGLEHSDGDYVSFLDADDLIYDFKSLQTLYDLIDSKNYDYAYGAIIQEAYGIGKVVEEHNGCLHGKIYKREYLNKKNITFNPTRTSEDYSFNHLCVFGTYNFAASDEVVYIYKDNKKSLTKGIDLTKTIDNLVDFVDNIIYVMDHVDNRFSQKVVAFFLDSYFYVFKNYEYYKNQGEEEKMITLLQKLEDKGKIYDEETISKVAPAFSFINFKNTLN